MAAQRYAPGPPLSRQEPRFGTRQLARIPSRQMSDRRLHGLRGGSWRQYPFSHRAHFSDHRIRTGSEEYNTDHPTKNIYQMHLGDAPRHRDIPVKVALKFSACLGKTSPITGKQRAAT